MICSYETREVTGAGDGLAHNSEVAGSNPVPATKESGPDQAKRPSASAGGRFVLGTLGTKRADVGAPRRRVFGLLSACDRWVRFPCGRRIVALQRSARLRSSSTWAANNLDENAAGDVAPWCGTPRSSNVVGLGSTRQCGYARTVV